MSYISKEDVKLIRRNLKQSFKNKIKFSITRRDSMVVDVSILESEEDFSDILDNYGYNQLNIFYLENHVNHVDTLLKIKKIIEDVGYQDCVVIDGDYGNIPTFYYNINIGKENKCWQLKETK